MQDGRDGTGSSNAPAQPIAVSPDNPCPFLRAVVSEGFVGGHVVPLSTLAGTVQAASGKTGFPKAMAGVKTWMVALIANGLGLCRLVSSAWSGATLDQLRNGPLDKHGVGSRILSATAHVNEEELARFASFGKDRADPSGGTERGLTASEIETFMDANFERAKGHRRRIDRKLMKGEWPVLLDIMGKGEGEHRYLSVAEVRTLFTERRLPERINARLKVRPTYSGVVRTIARVTAGIVALAAVAAHRGRRIPRTDPPDPDDRETGAAGASGPRAGEGGLLARPELVNAGPVLVSPREPGHCHLPGALCLVHRSRAAGPAPVHPAGHARRQRLSRAVRIYSEPKDRRHRRSHAAPFWICELRCQDRAGAGAGGGPEAVAGGQYRRLAGRLCAHD